jgi:hypothetical protein
MPVHDWTRVEDGIFHDFHMVWIGELRTRFNAGILPADCYALAEQVAGGIGPDVLSLRMPADSGSVPDGDGSQRIAVLEKPPRARMTFRATRFAYTTRQRSVVIRHSSDHRIIALIEIVSPGNKASRYPLQQFVDKALAALSQGIHLLLVDLLPPGRRDPQGIHGVLWEALTGESYTQPAEAPLTLAAYCAALEPRAYIEPVAVGSLLPDMPLFLDPDWYVNVPLEATYQAVYAGVPRYYREILERPRETA